MTTAIPFPRECSPVLTSDRPARTRRSEVRGKRLRKIIHALESALRVRPSPSEQVMQDFQGTERFRPF